MAAFDRREFLTTLGRGAIASVALGALPPWARAALAADAPADLLVRNAWPEHYETTIAGLGKAWLTSNDRFFVRSHFPVPTIDPAKWRLEVGGLVRKPLSLSLADLGALPQVEATHTLECAGNGRGLFDLHNTSGTQWERGAVGNAAWGGVRLEAVLRKAEALPEAKHVWLEAADLAPLPAVPPFLRSIPIEKAMDDTLLATRMNGVALPRLHGAPLRAIVPGWYGMASTKWVTRVRVESAPSDNHFMAKGYRYAYPGEDPARAAPVEEMRVKSLITSPLEGASVARGKVTVRGWAWSGRPGATGVTAVEISTDGGKTWVPAALTGPSAAHAWRGWQAEVAAKAPGTLRVMARARDGGEAQPLEARPNASGYANNSIHAVTFRVA